MKVSAQFLGVKGSIIGIVVVNLHILALKVNPLSTQWSEQGYSVWFWTPESNRQL
jgi:hypothetical protein